MNWQELANTGKRLAEGYRLLFGIGAVAVVAGYFIYQTRKQGKKITEFEKRISKLQSSKKKGVKGKIDDTGKDIEGNSKEGRKGV